MRALITASIADFDDRRRFAASPLLAALHTGLPTSAPIAAPIAASLPPAAPRTGLPIAAPITDFDDRRRVAASPLPALPHTGLPIAASISAPTAGFADHRPIAVSQPPTALDSEAPR